MKALELADAYADACFDQALNGRTEDPIPEKKRDELAAELRRLAAVEADCAPYLKEGETPAERIKRALGDADALVTLYQQVLAERDAQKAELDAEREESKRWLVKAQNERDARKELEAELERIKALEPVIWANPHGGFLSDGYMKNYATGLEKQTHTVALYALGSKT